MFSLVKKNIVYKNKLKRAPCVFNRSLTICEFGSADWKTVGLSIKIKQVVRRNLETKGRNNVEIELDLEFRIRNKCITLEFNPSRLF